MVEKKYLPQPMVRTVQPPYPDSRTLSSQLTSIHLYGLQLEITRESVDSVCRDGADMQYIYAILKQLPYNFTTNTTPKAYINTQPFSLCTFVISKT